jgi:DnaJ-class molecular chaperone
MQTPCITCDGRGRMANPRMAVSGRRVGTDHSVETCRTCGGVGSYDMLKGPGVDHAKVHGTGKKPE